MFYTTANTKLGKEQCCVNSLRVMCSVSVIIDLCYHLLTLIYAKFGTLIACWKRPTRKANLGVIRSMLHGCVAAGRKYKHGMKKSDIGCRLHGRLIFICGSNPYRCLRAGWPGFNSQEGQGFFSSSSSLDRLWGPPRLLFIGY